MKCRPRVWPAMDEQAFDGGTEDIVLAHRVPIADGGGTTDIMSPDAFDHAHGGEMLSINVSVDNDRVARALVYYAGQVRTPVTSVIIGPNAPKHDCCFATSCHVASYGTVEGGTFGSICF